jgi:hypothetical protein
MTISRIVAAFLLCALTGSAEADTVSAVLTMSDLRAISSGSPNQISVAGWAAAGDGGGGLFSKGVACSSFTPTGQTMAGSQSLPVSLTAGLLAGMGVNGPSGTTYLPPGETITAVDSVHSTVTLTIAALSTSPSGTTFVFSPDNGGSVIRDTEGYCYIRIGSTYGPKEWGAVTSGIPFQVALQNWLDNVQPHYGDVGNYQIDGPLTCPANTTIQGPSNLIGSSTKTPVFSIVASGGFSGTAIMQANDFCRLSGVVLDANNKPTVDTLDVAGVRVTVDGFSALINGVHNVICEAGESDGLQIKDAQIKGSSSDNVDLASNCANVRLVGDIVTTSGGAGVVFGGRDLIMADGVIEQSSGIGLDLSNASYASITGNFFDDNGKGSAGGAAIEINNSNTISICGNHLSGNDEYPTSGDTAEIRFGGSNDGVDLCGNVYAAENQTDDVTLKPSYVYDADDDTVMTNSTVQEKPAPQVLGVYTATAVKVIAPLQVPRLVPGYLSGFTLSNDTGKKINIAPGEAADSAASTIIQSSLTCNVDLGARGAGGLDADAVAGATTYFYYSISQVGGSTPGCIASTSPSRPSFRQTSGSSYATFTKYRSVAGSPLLYNVNSVAGVVANDEIRDDSYIPTDATVVSVGTLTLQQVGSTYMSDHTKIQVADVSQMAFGMAVSDGSFFPACTGTALSKIANNSTITDIDATHNVITLSSATSGGVSNDCIVGSGGNVIEMSENASHTTPTTGSLPSAKIFTGVYRMVGALYTDASSNVVGFTQDGDTFYLKTSVTDIQTSPTPVVCTASVGNVATNCALSVPCGRNAACSSGIKVEAFGRIAGGTNMLFLSSLDQSDQGPAAFPNAPGYSVKNTAPQVSFPFRLYTDTAGQVRVRASGTSPTTAYEVTDGWVLHRAQ